MSENTNEAAVRQIDNLRTECAALGAEVERYRTAFLKANEAVSAREEAIVRLQEGLNVNEQSYQDTVERAEAAEAERDRARSLAATLEARLAQEQAKVARVEALIDKWFKRHPNPEFGAWTTWAADNIRAALKGDA